MRNFTGKVYVCTRVGGRIIVHTVLRDDTLIASGFQFGEETQGGEPPRFIQCNLPMTNKGLSGKTAHFRVCVGEFTGITFDFVVPSQIDHLVSSRAPGQMVAFSNIHDLAIFMDSVH